MADLNTLLMVAVVAMVFGVFHIVHGDASAEAEAVQRAGPEDKASCAFNPTDPINIVTHHNGDNYYGIGGKKHWKLSTDNKVEREATKYDNVPDDLDAGFSIVWYRPDEYIKYSYLFKGKEYWRVSNNNLNEGYPLDIAYSWGGIEEVDATLRITLSNSFASSPPLLYFFKGSQYWKWNTKTDQLADGYPLNITDYWEGLPNDLDGAFEAPNGVQYFIKGGQYYKLTDRRWSVAKVERVKSPFAWC